MTKNWKWMAATVVATLGIFWFYKQYALRPLHVVSQLPVIPKATPVLKRDPSSIPTPHSPQAPKNLVLKAPPHWQKPLEEDLRDLGREDLKEVTVLRERTINWNDRGQIIQAEAVKISLKNQKNETTNFRALVDASTGKIIHTWDQPVYDAINPRENFGIKLDPRYNP